MENPELLFGVPLLIVGSIGLLAMIEMLLAGDTTRSKAEAAGRAGLMAFVGLGAATIIEYVIAVEIEQSMVLLVLIALLKAAVIVQFFMHVMRMRHAGHEEE